MTWVDRLREHEAVYRRAPSAHNTQPWTLEYRTDEVIIGVDPARSLPASDPGGRDLALGLGAFAEGCLIVAAELGLAVACDLTDPRRIRLVPSTTRYATAFSSSDVAARRVARGALCRDRQGSGQDHGHRQKHRPQYRRGQNGRGQNGRRQECRRP